MPIISQRLGETPTEFLSLYNPSAGVRLLTKGYSSGRVALLSNIPTLTDVQANFGTETVVVWLTIQIDDIDNLSGSSMFHEQTRREAALLILSAYGDMTVAELLNFFARYKLGEYTQVTQYYGGLQKILIALRHYHTMRDDDLLRLEIEAERKKAEAEQSTRKCITYEEYLKTKEL